MNDTRYKDIGTKHRAESRYYMILNRLKNTHLPKNKGYKGVSIDIEKEDFVEWFMANDFEGCSVDRIDVSKGYNIENMQLIDMSENISKDKTKMREGKIKCYSCGTIKDKTDFVKESRRKNGYSTLCKSCERVRGIEKYKKRKV